MMDCSHDESVILWLNQLFVTLRPYSVISGNVDLDARLVLDLHLDSLEMLEVVSSVEAYLGLSIPDEDWMKWHRVQNIVDFICIKRK